MIILGKGPGFVGSPYEFWVGSNVGIGTSIGQIKVNDAMDKNDVSYDLLHGYEQGGKHKLWLINAIFYKELMDSLNILCFYFYFQCHLL